MATTAIPAVPSTGSWPVYNEVERFLIHWHNREETFAASYEELGRLARLIDDLRLDAGHLDAMAGQLDKLLSDGVDEIRNAEVREARARAGNQ